MICFNLIAFDKTVVPNIHTFYKAFSSNVDRIKHDLENLQLHLTKLGRNGGLP